MIIYEKHWFGESESFQAYPLRDFSFPYHFHRSYELICVIAGSINLNLDDKLYCLSEGDIAYIFPNQLHSFVTNGESLIMIVIFSPELIPDFTSKYYNKLPVNPIIKYSTLHENDFAFRNTYQRKSFVYSICSALIENTAFAPIHSQSDRLKLLHQILSYIENHLDDSCTLAEVAIELGYDYTYLSKFFQSKMGQSYTSYLNQYRITHACHLLNNSSDSISTIAMKCGYESIRTFNRNFRKIMGTPPDQYRKL